MNEYQRLIKRKNELIYELGSIERQINDIIFKGEIRNESNYS